MNLSHFGIMSLTYVILFKTFEEINVMIGNRIVFQKESSLFT